MPFDELRHIPKYVHKKCSSTLNSTLNGCIHFPINAEIVFFRALFPTRVHDTVLLGAASQRIEYLALEFIGTPWLLDILEDWKKHERGAIPGPTEFCIIIFIISM